MADPPRRPTTDPQDGDGAGLRDGTGPPILRHKRYDQPSLFLPENLLREARRQKGLAEARVPRVCALDPDGDIVHHLVSGNVARRNPFWACYHTSLHDVEYDGVSFGILGAVVGAPFAVLVAEELFASGCELLIHVTSAGQIAREPDPPFFVLIEKALRDEGTSYHYLPPGRYSDIDARLLLILEGAFDGLTVQVRRGATWTTDAPFRETPAAIEAARSQGFLAVEMEAAGLYAFARARARSVVCFAHVTNRMGTKIGDFEKGAEAGSRDALRVIAETAKAWRRGKR